jgi:hypothetical protein
MAADHTPGRSPCRNESDLARHSGDWPLDPVSL